MEIKDRIRMIMEREKVPPKVFAKTIGVQQSTLSHILNGRNKPSLDVIMKVHQKYDYVNLEWLLYGEGEMMVSEEETSFSSSNIFLAASTRPKAVVPSLLVFANSRRCANE